MGALTVSLQAHGSQNGALYLIHSNDVSGELEPCGCRGNPQGGLARKQNLLTQYARQRGAHFLQLDAGDLFFPTAPTPNALRAQAELTAKYLLKGLEMTGLDAFTPGEKDFALGTEFLLKLLENSKIKALSANLARSSDSKLVWDAYQVFERQGPNGKVRVGVFGLSGSAKTASSDPFLAAPYNDSLPKFPPDLKVLSPIESAKNAVKKLRELNVDIVIALTHQGLQADQDLIHEVAGIDIVVGGHSQSYLQVPFKLNSTTIVQSSFRNQAIGVLNLTEKTAEDPYQLVALEQFYASPKEAPNDIDRLTAEWKLAVERLNDSPQPTPSPSGSDQINTVTSTSPSIRTFPHCLDCHQKEARSWIKTSHFRALTPLLKGGHVMNKECLSCHTVGFNQPSGWADPKKLAKFSSSALKTKNRPTSVQTTPEAHEWKSSKEFAKFLDKIPTKNPDKVLSRLKNLETAYGPVQCENCHRTSASHPFDSSAIARVQTSQCLECHTAERAPKWWDKNRQPLWSLINDKKKAIHH